MSTRFRPTTLTGHELELREQVRRFVAEEFPAGEYLPGLGINAEASPEFSRKLARQGWLGMVVPAEYGGPGRTAVERFVVVEELLVAGAPISAHWVGDRQTAPALLKFGSEEQKRRFLPAIIGGEAWFCLGMSEPGSGSDLASVRTSAVRTDGGWVLNGQKIWTSGAHYADFVVTLCRTAPLDGVKHAGLSQLIVDLRSPGIEVRPIMMLNGFHHFNEVFFTDVFVPDEMVLGAVGDGWHQVTSELAYERSGPDRFLTSFPLLRIFLALRARRAVGAEAEHRIGRLVARYWVLRQMSLSVARSLDAGEVPAVEAALVKDMGTTFEQQVVDVVRELADAEQRPGGDLFDRLLAEATITTPTFTLRGGTNEVLRQVAAKSLLRGAGRAA
ncbi:acyl-CoA dehydrogenase family protein [Pseudonocardia humida]|uniref:Acyl-CoA dehydrogenase family protein n=1 Tax=Pseudonocardia humida TaxID=2800819 RepID=A0ABT1A2H7_9PSEU|nr:acyl-CoA dehydrogenase family protein [Pseudonocardia humida]MCO1657074.1 acyl-CoA dehydrogenase family protein [Pseudonocardia humida]